MAWDGRYIHKLNIFVRFRFRLIHAFCIHMESLRRAFALYALLRIQSNAIAGVAAGFSLWTIHLFASWSCRVAIGSHLSRSIWKAWHTRANKFYVTSFFRQNTHYVALNKYFFAFSNIIYSKNIVLCVRAVYIVLPLLACVAFRL